MARSIPTQTFRGRGQAARWFLSQIPRELEVLWRVGGIEVGVRWNGERGVTFDRFTLEWRLVQELEFRSWTPIGHEEMVSRRTLVFLAEAIGFVVPSDNAEGGRFAAFLDRVESMTNDCIEP